MSSAEKANLTRIRDNQRRSRARRKEYLQSLEERWRACELQGVEASAEIQAAARRVAMENRRLRGLLRARGMSEGDIDRFLREEGEMEVGASGLEGMLGTRRPCTGGSGSGGCREQCGEGCGGVVGGGGGGGRQSPPPTSIPNYLQPSMFEDGYPPLLPTSNADLTHSLVTAVQPNNTTPCRFGASLITDMRAKASEEEVTAAMGCPPGVADCEVDNTVLFGVIDRFTGGV